MTILVIIFKSNFWLNGKYFRKNERGCFPKWTTKRKLPSFSKEVLWFFRYGTLLEAYVSKNKTPHFPPISAIIFFHTFITYGSEFSKTKRYLCLKWTKQPKPLSFCAQVSRFGNYKCHLETHFPQFPTDIILKFFWNSIWKYGYFSWLEVS